MHAVALRPTMRIPRLVKVRAPAFALANHWRLLVAVLVPLVAVVDWKAGPEISTSILYLAPIALAASRGSRVLAMGVALVCAVLWLALDLADGAYSHPAVPFWNALVRLGIFVSIAWLVERNRRLREAEHELARTDALTGVPNSRAFHEALLREAVRARRTELPLTVAYIDLDDFKEVNDRSGHQAGDSVLRATAGAIRDAVRAVDVVARLAGDEFAVLLVETDETQAASVLERMRGNVLAAMRDAGWPVTLSIGAATFHRVPDDLDAMVRAADAHMYAVKRSGKNKIGVERAAEPAERSAG